MDVAALLVSLALLQVGDDGLRSALVRPPTGSAVSNPATAPPATHNPVANSATPAGSFEPAVAEESMTRISSARSATGTRAPGKGAMGMIERLLVSPRGQSLDRVRLEHAITAASLEQRGEAIQAYWRLSRAYARQCALERYRTRLEECALVANGDAERTLASAALRQAEAQLQDAEAGFAQARESLLLLSRGPFSTEFLPASLPHAGGYDTRFDEIFANQSASAEVQQLNAQIPARRNVVNARVECVVAAEDAYRAFMNARAEGLVQTADCQNAAARLFEQELAFAESIYAYNQDIAAYALAVGGEQSPAVLAGMLIKDREIPTSSADVAERVIPVSGSDGFRAAGDAAPPTGQSTLAPNATGAPRTFHPPLEAGPLPPTPSSRNSTLPNSATGDPASNSDTANPGGRSALPASSQQGWEPVPGYQREGSPPTGAGGNGEPTPANGLRPLTERYNSYYRGAHAREVFASSLPQQLADFSPGQTETISLCECWNQASGSGQPEAAAAYWQACWAACGLQDRRNQSGELQALQRELLQMSDHPRRTIDMLVLRAARSDLQAQVLEAELRLQSAAFSLGEAVNRPGVALEPKPFEDKYTRMEQRLQTGAEPAVPTSFGQAARRLREWEQAATETEVAFQAAALDFRSGGSVDGVLATMVQRRETSQAGLLALIEFRTEVAEFIAANVSPAEQCAALTELPEFPAEMTASAQD